ncbi:hypothetical protein AAVH_07671 [Aphelenchoides avenae]|nr:hypothetical protein AAVH_07671 [Aphelenchus avenae]
MPSGCYKLAHKREKAEADELAQVLDGFERDLDENDVGNVSDAEIDEEQPTEGHNNGESDFSDDNDFWVVSSYIVDR